MTTYFKANSRLLVSSLLCLAIFGARFFYTGFANDQFDRIGKGRQMLVHGEVPFRDFFDPGFFLTLYSSAAVQWIFGRTLLGEALLNSAYIAVGFTIALWLAYRLSDSLTIAFCVALVAAATWPRLYNYDKVLFFPLGLLACWAYLQKRTPSALVAAAGVTALAAMYRYDSGVYIACSVLVGLALLHSNAPRTLAKQAAVYATATLVALTPALLVIQATGGLQNAFRQVAEYGQREALRTHVLSQPSFNFNAFTPRDVLTPANAGTALFYLLLSLPLLTAIGAVSSRHVEKRSMLLSGAALCLIANLALLRNPIEARIGDVAAPAVPLAAWLLREALLPRSGGWTRALLVGAPVGLVAAMSIVASVTLALPATRGTDKLQKLKDLTTAPTGLALLPAGHAAGPVIYFRECTSPHNRILIPWFAPEVYYFADRGFAGGMSVFFGAHWSSEADQRETIRKLQRQSVPVVLIDVSEEPEFERSYGIVAGYLRTAYNEAARSEVGDPLRIYRVLVHKEAVAARLWGQDRLPCFR